MIFILFSQKILGSARPEKKALEYIKLIKYMDVAKCSQPFHSNSNSVDHTLINVPLANDYLDSMYYSSPVYLVINGNVRGTRQMLPDPDWKAEDQSGAWARTGVSNNNDNDNHVGDMPSWMF